MDYCLFEKLEFTTVIIQIIFYICYNYGDVENS